MPEELRRLLVVGDLVSGYRKKQVLNGITLEISAGEIVALIGHNGAGKSTLLKALFGLIPVWEGRVVLDGKVLRSSKPQELLRAGVSYVPQGNRVFSDLSVRENLEMAGVTLPNGRLNEGFDRVFVLFPMLKPLLGRRAGTLSGGEKQMLALANALVLSPRLLLLDEPSLGLSPSLVVEALKRIQQISVDSGTAVLIVEQKVREVLKIAHRVLVLRNGNIAFSGLTADLSDENKLRDVYL